MQSDIPFIDRSPTKEEAMTLLLAMSTYSDGTGQQREKDGSTRPGWRDFERIFAETLKGFAPENKDIFDVIVPSGLQSKMYGVSVKSKHLARASAIKDLEEQGRVHMELANSPAKFWAALSAAHSRGRFYRYEACRADRYRDSGGYRSVAP